MRGARSASRGRCPSAGASVSPPAVLRGRRTKAVERGLQDRLEVAGLAANRRDGDDHVEDLLEREIVPDLIGALGGEEERPAGPRHAAAALAHDGGTSP